MACNAGSPTLGTQARKLTTLPSVGRPRRFFRMTPWEWSRRIVYGGFPKLDMSSQVYLGEHSVVSGRRRLTGCICATIGQKRKGV